MTLGADISIVSDYLTTKAGGERVTYAMMTAFPHAELRTSMYDPENTFGEFKDYRVRSTILDRIPGLHGDLRRALPFLSPAFRSMELSGRIAICSSAGWSHFVPNPGVKVVYCHNPPRWLHQKTDYGQGLSSSSRAVLKVLDPALSKRDQEGALSADAYIANSSIVRDRIARTYGLKATVIHPPVMFHERSACSRPVDVPDGGYLLTVARSRGYKNVAAAENAASALGVPLVVVGGDPSIRSRFVHPVRNITDAELAWLYKNAKCLVASSYEDFGLTPIEANVFGTPVLALRYGGYLDTVREGVNGYFFEDLDANSIALAYEKLDANELCSDDIVRHAGKFSLSTFQESLRCLVDEVADRKIER